MRVVEDPLNRETIQAITQLIVERFEPEQVILFGSCARGEEDENSDLDLMVVLRPGVEPPRRGNPIHAAIADHFVLPVDLLIRSYEAFATYRPNPNSMLSRMLEDSECCMTDARPEQPPGSPKPTTTLELARRALGPDRPHASDGLLPRPAMRRKVPMKGYLVASSPVPFRIRARPRLPNTISAPGLSRPLKSSDPPPNSSTHTSRLLAIRLAEADPEPDTEAAGEAIRLAQQVC